MVLFFCVDKRKRRLSSSLGTKKNEISSLFFTKKEVIGFNEVIKKIPKITARILGTKITEKLDRPETFIAIISSVFFIFKKNQIPDIKITNGKKLFSKLGTNRSDRIMGVVIVTSKSLKKFISSNIFIIKPKQKKTMLALITILINSILRYLFNKKDLIIIFNASFHI